MVCSLNLAAHALNSWFGGVGHRRSWVGSRHNLFHKSHIAQRGLHVAPARLTMHSLFSVSKLAYESPARETQGLPAASNSAHRMFSRPITSKPESVISTSTVISRQVHGYELQRTASPRSSANSMQCESEFIGFSRLLRAICGVCDLPS